MRGPGRARRHLEPVKGRVLGFDELRKDPGGRWRSHYGVRLSWSDVKEEIPGADYRLKYDLGRGLLGEVTSTPSGKAEVRVYQKGPAGGKDIVRVDTYASFSAAERSLLV